MKRTIRRGVFETNSSSVHSLTMCSNEEYSKWKSEECLYWEEEGVFDTKENIINELKNKRCSWVNKELYYPNTDWNDEDSVYDVFNDEGIQTMKEYFDNGDYETFNNTYTTPNGEVVHAFGYYGHD